MIETKRMVCGFREIKMDDAEGSMKFTGYGAVFNNIDKGGDAIVPGAFSEYLEKVEAGEESWPAMLSQHGGMGITAEDLTPVGVWLDLTEDDNGLKVEGEFAATPRGSELHTLMKMAPRPAIDGLSIGYRAKDWERGMTPEDPDRFLKKIYLLEISPVTFPMNGEARVDAVKRIEGLGNLKEIEAFLRDAAGLNRKEAMTLISRIKSNNLSDSSKELSQLTSAVDGVLKSFQAA